MDFIKKLLAVTGIYLLLSAALAVVEAQSLNPEAGVRISWPANPTAQEVDTYTVSWFDGSADQWVLLGNVDHVDDQRLSYVTRLVWIKSTLQAGNELCFRIVAFKADEQSPPSESACGVVPDRFAVVEVPEVTLIELTAPSGVTVEWLDN